MGQSILRPDLLPQSLLVDNNRIAIASGISYQNIIRQATQIERSRTPNPAADLPTFFNLIQDIISDYERRQNITQADKVWFCEEDPDALKEEQHYITFSVVRRLPGAFSQGAPFEGNIQNQIPILREEIDDPNYPGYKQAIMGYFHDNEVRFNVYGRTAKAANAKALWFEQIMQEYTWYLTSRGVTRVLFLKRNADFYTEINSSKFHCRPLHYFVRTETLHTVSQKTIEQIQILSSNSTVTGSVLNT